MQGFCEDGHCHSLIMLDNIVRMDESAESEEGADWPHPHPGDLQGGVVAGWRSHCSTLRRGLQAVVRAFPGEC
jgi:hypothetical protein